MRTLLLIATVTIFLGCSSESKVTEFGALSIPSEYVLHAPSISSTKAFDYKDIDIALVISEKEVKESMPEYTISVRGERELSFVIKKKTIDLNAVSNSILKNFTKSNGQVYEDKYLPYLRLYRSPESWLLVSSKNGEKKLEAQCRKSGIKGDIEVCDFKSNLGEYGISFHLANSNIALAEKFKGFLRQKIEEWKP